MRPRLSEEGGLAVQDGQHRPVARRVDELLRVLGGGQRAGLRLAVADNAAYGIAISRSPLS